MIIGFQILGFAESDGLQDVSFHVISALSSRSKQALVIVRDALSPTFSSSRALMLTSCIRYLTVLFFTGKIHGLPNRRRVALCAKSCKIEDSILDWLVSSFLESCRSCIRCRCFVVGLSSRPIISTLRTLLYEQDQGIHNRKRET